MGGEKKMSQLSVIREKAGYTQMQVALFVGVDRSAVAKWETGVCMPRLTNLFKLAKLYNCTVNDLLKDRSA